jgi:hypothetical protein
MPGRAFAPRFFAVRLERGGLSLGLSVVLEPREGLAGWRGVISAPGAGQIALGQPKEWR